jgi:hypothetical protein
LALPFEVRDRTRDYKETLLVLEDLFDIKIKHGDNTNDAVGILDGISTILLTGVTGDGDNIVTLGDFLLAS